MTCVPATAFGSRQRLGSPPYAARLTGAPEPAGPDMRRHCRDVIAEPPSLVSPAVRMMPSVRSTVRSAPALTTGSCGAAWNSMTATARNAGQELSGSTVTNWFVSGLVHRAAVENPLSPVSPPPDGCVNPYPALIPEPDTHSCPAVLPSAPQMIAIVFP